MNFNSAMKFPALFLSLSLFFIILGGLSSCSEEEEKTPAPVVNPDRVITAKVDGTAYTFGETSLDDLPSGGVWIYLGVSGDKAMSVRFVKNEVGTFDLDSVPNSSYSIGYTEKAFTSESVDYLAEKGVIVLTKNSLSEVRGTFSGTLSNVFDSTDKVEVTEGVFTFLE